MRDNEVYNIAFIFEYEVEMSGVSLRTAPNKRLRQTRRVVICKMQLSASHFQSSLFTSARYIVIVTIVMHCLLIYLLYHRTVPRLFSY